MTTTTMTTKRMRNNADPASKLDGESSRALTTNDSPSYDRTSPVPPRQTAEFTSQVAPGQTTSKRFEYLRRASLLSRIALLVAPLVAIPPVMRVLVDHTAPILADIATTNLERVFAWRTVGVGEHREPDAVLRERAPHPTDDASRNENSNDDNDEDVVAHRAPQPNTPRHRGIVVRADAVIRAVHSGGRPSSVPAPASGQRPAGLSLAGVSHFGTGLHDGDILTSVGGTSATSEGAVIGTVAGAISQGAKVITGVVWRDEQRIDVAVEIPSPEAFSKPRRRKSGHK